MEEFIKDIWLANYDLINISAGLMLTMIGFYISWRVFIYSDEYTIKRSGYYMNKVYNEKYCEFIKVKSDLGRYKVVEFKFYEDNLTLGCDLESIQLK